MKRIITLILSILIILSLTVAAVTSVDAKVQNKYNKYKNVFSKAYAAQKEYNGVFEGSSFLYDFDKNGTKELAILYGDYDNYSPASNEYRVNAFYLSLYTLKNGKVKTIIKKKKLQVDAGGPEQCIGVAKKNGKLYFFSYVQNTGGENIYATIKYYKIKGSKATVKYKTTHFYPVYTSEYKTTIKGKKVTNAKYRKFVKSFKYKYVKLTKPSYLKKSNGFIFVNSTCNSMKRMYKKLLKARV